MPETLGRAPGFAEVEPYLPSSSSSTLGAGQASEAGPGARAGVFGMDPSWWVACRVAVEPLCQTGSQQGVPPVSQPWASGSLVTCQAAGTAPRGPRGPWGGRRRPQGPPRRQPAPGPGAPGPAACRVPPGEAALPGRLPRRRRRQGSAGAAGTRPRHGPTSLRPVPASGLRVESAPRAALRDPGLSDPNSGFRALWIRDPGFPNPSSRVPFWPGLGQGRPRFRSWPGRFRIRDRLRARLPPPASGGLATRVRLPKGGD